MRAFLSSPASRAVALLAVVSSAAGCATKGDLRNVQTEIRELRVAQDSILAELVRQRRMTADTLGNQSRTLSNLQGNVSQQLRDIADGLDELRELAGQNSRDIAGIRDQMAALARSGRGAPMGVEPGVAGAPGEAMASSSPDTLYQAANDAYNRGSWTAARLGFNRFLEQYPQDELAPRVHYKLADILVQEGRLEDAIEKFQVIRQLFPDSPEVPEALYRIGLLYIDLDNEAEARRYLRMVVNSYSDSLIAEQAQRRLDELGG